MGDIGSTVLMLVAMGAVFYFLLIRPQQKRAKQQQSLTDSLNPGARVMLSSGVLGTIRHLGERQAIIEIAPGVEMTVVKGAIVRMLDADDDEFEYSDDDEPAGAPAASDDEPSGSMFDSIEPSDFADPKPAETASGDDDQSDRPRQQ